MPLKKGISSIKSNYLELTQQPVVSPARQKAILTIMKKHNISHDEAVHKQALRIIKSQARK